MKRYSLIVFLLFSLLGTMVAQNKIHPEQRIYLWDVTGSLLPNSKGIKDVGHGKELPMYAQGNNMWNAVKKNLVSSIQSIEDDANSEIVIIPFYAKVLDKVTFSATSAGKQAAINYINSRIYKVDTPAKTNIVAPIEEAYNLVKSNYVNYVFIYTDGENEVGGSTALASALNNWNNKTQSANQWTFGFYILVDPAADKPAVRDAERTQTRFYVVDDATQIISLVQMPVSMHTYNIKEDSFGEIQLEGNYQYAVGDILLTSSNPYYDLECQRDSISKGKYQYRLIPKDGIKAPVEYVVTVQSQLVNTNKYTISTISECKIKVFNRPEKVLRIEPITVNK